MLKSKQIIILFLGALLVGTFGAGFYLYNNEKKAIYSYPPKYSESAQSVTQFMPDGAGLVLFIKGLGQNWEAFTRSGFFRQLIKYQAAPAISSLAPLKGNGGFMEKLEHFLAREIFLAGFGQDIIMGIFPPNDKEKTSFLAISKISPLFGIKELIFTQYMKVFSGEKLTTHKLGKFSATTIINDFQGNQVHYAQANGAIILSNSINKIREVIGIWEGSDVPRLVDSHVYLEGAANYIADARNGMLVDYESLFESGNLPSFFGKPEDNGEQFITSSFSRISFNKGILMDTQFNVNPDKLAGFREGFVSSTSADYKSIKYLPQDTILFLGSLGVRLENFFDIIAGGLKRANSINNMKGITSSDSEIDENPGGAPKENYSHGFGNEWGIALMEQQGQENVLPGIVAIIEVEDSQMIDGLVKKLTLSGNRKATEQRSYKDFRVNYVKGNGPVNINYFQHDNFLFAGSNAQCINSVIDTIKEEKPSLSQGKIFSISGILPTSHFLFLFDTGELFDFAKAGLDMAPITMFPGLEDTKSALTKPLSVLNFFSFMVADVNFDSGKIKSKAYLAFEKLPGQQTKAPSTKKAKTPVTDQKETTTVEQAKKETTTVEQAKKETTTVEQAKKETTTVEQAKKETTTVEQTKPVIVPQAKGPGQKDSMAPGQEQAKPVIAPPAKWAEEKATMASLTTTEKNSTPVKEPVAVEKEIAPEKMAGIKDKKEEIKEEEVKPGSEKSEKNAVDEDTKEGSKQDEKEKEEFYYTNTYQGKPKRDPFISLILLAQSKKSRTVDISSLREGLEKIEPINMYIYNHVRKEEPNLINKIESFTRYFKNTKRLETLAESEVKKKMQEYTSTVADLNRKYKSKVSGTIDFDLDSKSLVGIITTHLNNFALVQGSDMKGHTLKLGDVVGSEYGEIISILKSKIVIEEKNRDYLGKILTNTKMYELKKEED